MSQTTAPIDLIDLRRDLHRHPEPAWREFYTTSRILDAIDRVGVDERYVGRDALAEEDRMAVPDDEELETWFEQAREEGANPDHLAELAGGYTGAIAVLEMGEGPTVALRVDIDGLLRAESDDPDHFPAAEGFRSIHEGAMHACGHDAHATIGIGVLQAIKASDFSGTLKVCFQPGEEYIAGGKAMANSGHLDDVDYLLALHVGLEHPTGAVVAGVDGFLAVTHIDAQFIGEGAHAGAKPQEGRNAVQAMATAIGNLYGIARHDDGATRVNAGRVGGGTAANIVPESAFIEGEVRGETTDLMEYIRDRALEVIDGAATSHGCVADVEVGSEAPSATSDQGLVDLVQSVAGETTDVESVVERDELGGSEDATFFMKRVQDRGGQACYVGLGTDHPGGHHTATFDVDERTIGIGVDVIAGVIERLSESGA